MSRVFFLGMDMVILIGLYILLSLKLYLLNCLSELSGVLSYDLTSLCFHTVEKA